MTIELDTVSGLKHILPLLQKIVELNQNKGIQFDALIEEYLNSSDDVTIFFACTALGGLADMLQSRKILLIGLDRTINALNQIKDS